MGLSPTTSVLFFSATSPSHLQTGWSELESVTKGKASQHSAFSGTMWLAQGHHRTQVSNSQDLCRSKWKRLSFPLDWTLGALTLGCVSAREVTFWEWSPYRRDFRHGEGDMGSLTACEPWTQPHPQTVLHLAFLLPEPIQYLPTIFWWGEGGRTVYFTYIFLVVRP